MTLSACCAKLEIAFTGLSSQCFKANQMTGILQLVYKLLALHACLRRALDTDLRLKAHVKHAVCLIKHQVGHPEHGACFHLDEVDHAPWSADSHLHPTTLRVRPSAGLTVYMSKSTMYAGTIAMAAVTHK